MTISGYEWMMLIPAFALLAGIGVAGVGTLVIEKLSRPRSGRVYELRPGQVAPAAVPAAVPAARAA
jgi:hypothetical protein